MTNTCLRCRDLRRQYGWAKEDVRDAARKCSRRVTPDLLERIKEAKASLAETTRLLNEHVASEHEGSAA